MDQRVIRRGLALAATMALACIAACGESEAPAAGTSGTSGASGTPAGESGGGASGESGTGAQPSADPDAELGVFSAQLVAPAAATELSEPRMGSTTIQGSVGDKRDPPRLVWETSVEAGDCTLITPRVPFCDPTCGRDICVEDDTCEAARTLVDVGTVVVRGVTTDDGASEVTLSAVRNNYQSGLTTMPYPAFDSGDTLELSATGAGEVPAFEISTRGIDRLEVIDGAELVIADGEDLTIEWVPAAETEHSRIEIELDISHHGGTKGKIHCDVEDTGSYALPGDLIGDLIALGVAGFPSVVITRSSEESVQLPNGRVRLRAYEYAERFVTVPGLVSCASADGCPSGQTCRDDKTCG